MKKPSIRHRRKNEPRRTDKGFGMLIFCLFLLISILYGQESPILQAMQDELLRTTKNLKLQKEKPPYYVAYRIDDKEDITITARFGAIVEDHSERTRNLYIDLRVGNYDFDNSNFVAGERSQFTGEENFTPLPLDDDYDAIRQKIWLATDAEYKAAIDLLAKKKSVVEHKALTETIPDFSRSSAYQKIEEIQKIKIDCDCWRKRVKEISNLFRNYPKLQTAKVVFRFSHLVRYFIDSEGNKQVTNHFLTYIETYARTQNQAGANLFDLVGFYAQKPFELPELSFMIDKVKAMAETLSLYTEVKEEKEYTGPVMFAGKASCQLFYQIFGKGVSDTRKPLYEQEPMEKIFEENTGFLAGKLNKSILPDYITIYDDPTAIDYQGAPLIGGYSVDDQGVKAENIELVKAGKLVTLPMSKKPLKEIKQSNGHGRFYNGVARNYISNLIVKSDKTTDDLEKELINLCKEKDLDYGIVISAFSPSIPKTIEEMEEEIYSYFGGGKPETPMLVPTFVAYKLYTDGRKELIKGLKFEGITPQVLKDIVAVGKDFTVYNTLLRERFGSDSYLPISVVAPSLIIEKMVLTSKEEKTKKQPYLTHPYFAK
uniref:Metalloprotease TldD/E C-terminal domain-containing protein n=1 Tax=candidate division WOR-3 bacterium TaxID=2052148 RepID=A0A7C6ECV1_UNCW3